MTDLDRDDAPAPDPAAVARLRAEFAALAAGPDEPEGGEPEPIDPATIWAAVHGELAPEDCVGIVDRLARDPELALEWRLALALREGEGEGAESSTIALAEPAAPANDRRYWAAGALALIAAAALVLIVTPRDPGAGVPGGEPAAGELDGGLGGGAVLREAAGEAAITSELDGASLPVDGFDLRWTPVAGALRYELRLTTRALDRVWEVDDLTAAEATVPAAQLEPLAPGTELIWQVTAVMPDGQRRSSAALTVSRR